MLLYILAESRSTMNLIKDVTSYLPVLTLLLSIIVAWMILPIVTGFPMVAFFIFFTGLSSLIYVVKKDKGWIDSILYFGVLTLSFFLIYRANEFLQFFNFLFIIFLISVLTRPLIDIRDIFRLLISPLTVFFNALTSQNLFKYTFSPPTFIKRRNYLKEYTPTILVTAVVLFTTIPLLASANPIFKNIFQQIFELFNLNWLFNYFIADSVVIYLIRILIFLFLAYMIPRALSVTLKGTKEYGTVPGFAINYLFPKISLAGILIVFFVTQLQLYFATPELLKSLGYTNSKLTNEVFAQVTIVAFIVLLFTYLDKSRKKWNTKLTYFLLLQAYFLIGVAFKSVVDYSALYGFTEKRLWGYASMTWLTGALGVYIFHFYRNTSVQSFIKQMLAFSVLVIFIINLLNFDYLIYHTAKPSTQAGIDYAYISKRSVDAHYYNEVLPKLINDIQISSAPDQSKILPAMNIIQSIKKLRIKYGEMKNLNSFNFAEYQEYEATKHMDIQAYEKIILDKKQLIKDQPLTPTHRGVQT
jgi:hypothetical protein